MTGYRSTRRRIIAAGLAAVGAHWLAPVARAQDAYPSRPIRVVVGHAAGGGVDILARHLGEHIRPLLGQPFVVENRPGANGMIGAQAVATAAPDGYTLLMASAGEIAISPHLFRKMAYDPFKDLQPVTLGTKVPNVLIVHPSVRASTTVELIALAKAAPRSLTYGSSGVGNLQHLNGELFNALAGTEIVHVPYKGAAPLIADLVAGQISMGFTSVAAAISLIKAGKLRPIAVTSRERVPALPDVPPLAETPALASYELNNWFGLFAPAGIPPAVLATLNTTAVKALSTPELQKRLVEQGGIPAPGTPQAFRDLIAADSRKFAQIIKDVNIPMEG
jgi:tripartite-type tricarboxylate transporter receptor subunit TctC